MFLLLGWLDVGAAVAAAAAAVATATLSLLASGSNSPAVPNKSAVCAVGNNKH
jgi:hypothetical protein